ncbi:MAG: SDR family NAD(P)-dependent oxidoreductase, partial [Ignavibacteria bacterium]
MMESSRKIRDLISLKGRVSLITGGAGYIGTAISEALAELGSDIIIVGRRKDHALKVVSRISQEYGVKSIFEEVDLNNKESIDLFVNKKRQMVDILVNNAFTWPNILKIEETSWEDFENTLRSGITSPFYLTKIIVEDMKRLGGGNIINIASMYGIVSPNFKIYREHPKLGNALAYNAAKSAIIQMTKYLAVYYAK